MARSIVLRLRSPHSPWLYIYWFCRLIHARSVLAREKLHGYVCHYHISQNRNRIGHHLLVCNVLHAIGVVLQFFVCSTPQPKERALLHHPDSLCSWGNTNGSNLRKTVPQTKQHDGFWSLVRGLLQRARRQTSDKDYFLSANFRWYWLDLLPWASPCRLLFELQIQRQKLLQ